MSLRDQNKFLIFLRRGNPDKNTDYISKEEIITIEFF